MTRDQAVARIKRGLGFRQGTGLDDAIVDALKEAQRDLEQGKTLPEFLLKIDETLTLTAGQHQIALPSGFLREDDDSRIRFFPENSTIPRFLERKDYLNAVQANLHSTGEDETADPVSPSVYVIRRSKDGDVIDFITEADITYTLYWDYFEADTVLSTNIENQWLLHAPEWLNGLAGYKIASDTRNQTAMLLFQDMMTRGRAACFGEILAAEEASGPYVMGANN